MFMGQRRFSLLFLLPLLALVVFSAPAAYGAGSLGKTHTNKEIGFSIRYPRDWKQVGSPESERYIVGKFISNKRLYNRKSGESSGRYSHLPEMRIIAFTPENKEIQETEVEGRTILGEEVPYTVTDNPYRDFKEYIKRNMSGFYFGDEKESKVKGVPCTYLDVMMEQARVPLRQMACIYHLGDVDVAVYIGIMEEWVPDNQSLFKSVFKSFKRVKREAKAASGPAAKPLTRKDFVKSKTENLESGWIWKETKSHLVISHADKKYTDKIGKFADAIRAMIAKHFKVSKKGKGKSPVTLPIVRICGSRDEFNSYLRNSGGYRFFNDETREVVVYDGVKQGYPVEWTFSRLGAGICQQFVNDQFDLALPADWYLNGMSYYYRCFKGKGSGVKYARDTWDTEFLRRYVKNGECSSLKEMLSPDYKGIRSYADYLKSGYLFCFLKSREGNRKPWKGVTEMYLQHFKDAYWEITEQTKFDIEDPDSFDEEAEEGEDGDDKKTRVKTIRFDEIRKEVRKRAYDETFSGWKESDWKKLEKAWEDWAI